MGPMPLTPPTSELQKLSRPTPSGLPRPTPVTTTRRTAPPSPAGSGTRGNVLPGGRRDPLRHALHRGARAAGQQLLHPGVVHRGSVRHLEVLDGAQEGPLRDLLVQPPGDPVAKDPTAPAPRVDQVVGGVQPAIDAVGPGVAAPAQRRRHPEADPEPVVADLQELVRPPVPAR